MFCMGQDQNKGVELEDKVVESQPYDVTRTMKVAHICINIDLTREEVTMYYKNLNNKYIIYYEFSMAL